jgi:uncharacterized protein YndB with AHSA1/START domain
MSPRTIIPAPIRKTLIIKADVARAFDTFVARMGRWWPKAHSIGSSPTVDVIIEPRAGGRWYERGENGAECEWGKVLVWEPPTRLVLAWQIDGRFKYSADCMTEVEVNFKRLSATETQVDFEHRHLERLGDNAAAIRELLNSGWPGILDQYRTAAASASL